jgi:non-ribosomal peptide synthetase component F
MRTSLAHDPTFAELLERVRDVSLGAFVHQELPFDKVVEALRPERDMGRNPLFQILFGLNNSPPPDMTLPGLSLTGLEVEKGTNIFDLSLFLTDGGPSVAGVLRYSTDLFEAASIARLRALYETLLAHVAAHPRARLSELRGVLESADAELKRAAVEDLKKLRNQVFRSVRRKALVEGG